MKKLTISLLMTSTLLMTACNSSDTTKAQEKAEAETIENTAKPIAGNQTTNAEKSTESVEQVPAISPNFTFYKNDDVWADALRLDPENYQAGEFEWWYTDGHLSNGSSFVASYHIDNQRRWQTSALCHFKFHR